jgi:hypothetical protein
MLALLRSNAKGHPVRDRAFAYRFGGSKPPNRDRFQLKLTRAC